MLAGKLVNFLNFQSWRDHMIGHCCVSNKGFIMLFLGHINNNNPIFKGGCRIHQETKF